MLAESSRNGQKAYAWPTRPEPPDTYRTYHRSIIHGFSSTMLGPLACPGMGLQACRARFKFSALFGAFCEHCSSPNFSQSEKWSSCAAAEKRRKFTPVPASPSPGKLKGRRYRNNQRIETQKTQPRVTKPIIKVTAVPVIKTRPSLSSQERLPPRAEICRACSSFRCSRPAQ